MLYDCWKDPECIAHFVQSHFDEFLDWCAENGYQKDEYPDRELEFCETKPGVFTEFGDKFLEDLIADEADRINDQNKAEFA